MRIQQVAGTLESKSTLIFFIPASLVIVQNEAAPTLETDSTWVIVWFPSWNVGKEDLVWFSITLTHYEAEGLFLIQALLKPLCCHWKLSFFFNENGVAKCFQPVPSPDGAKVSGSSALNMWNAEKSSFKQWKIQFHWKKGFFEPALCLKSWSVKGE